MRILKRITFFLLTYVSAVFAQNLNSGLTACYALNGNGTEPVNGLTATLNNVSSANDRFNNPNSALAFSGNPTSYVQLPNSPLIKPTTSLSAVGWIKTNSLTSQELIFAGNGCTSNFEGYVLALYNPGFGTKLVVTKSSANCQQAVLVGTTSISTQTWYHVGCYVGNDSLKIYLNGVLEGAMAINFAFAYSTQGVVLGGSNLSVYNIPFTGVMDIVSFYNRKLSGAEFAALYSTNSTLVVSASSSSICAGQSVTLTANGAGNLTWQPGGMSGNIIIVKPNVTTSYTVFGLSESCNSAPAVVTVTVGKYPSLTVQASKNNICAGEQVSLSASGAQNYTWQPGGSSAQSVTISPQSTTTYTLYGDNSGCPSSMPVTIAVGTSPAFTVTAQPGVICQGNATIIRARGAGSYTLVPQMTRDSSFVISPNVSTTYTVLASNLGTCISERTVHIGVIAAPTFSMGGPGVICSGQNITVTAIGPGTFNWMPGNLNGSTMVLSPTSTTEYQVVHTGGSGCNFKSTFIVTVLSCDGPLFGITNAASTPSLQHGNYYLINFTVIAVNNSPINLNQVRLNSDLAATFPSPCTYTVLHAPKILSHNSALVPDNSFDGRTNLSITSAATSTLLPNKRDTLQYTVLVAPNGFYGTVRNSVVGTAESLFGFTYADSSNNGFLWDPDKDGDPTNNNEVTLIDIRRIDLFVPEGFSPNGDGTYDEFIIKGMQGRKARLIIFNRWGSKVFEDEGTDLRWDGKAHFGLVVGNDLVPPSTYYYILQYVDGAKESMNGFVEVKY